ncbi:MAG: response regulator transcription factor [Clostridiales bacterium]|nr:response regulator transcription factor [Clostridiales bacterium]
MQERIFIVEDDESIRRLLAYALESQSCRTFQYRDVVTALEAMEEDRPDLVLMDIMMDGLDGVSAVKRMRSDAALRDVPVIMLTARDMEADKIAGLDAGADDYITKPFSVLELCARVRAILRRTHREPQDSCLTYPGLTVDTGRHEVRVDGAPVELTFKEFELLRYLMERPGRTVPRRELLEQIWGSSAGTETRTLDIHIRTLRQKLGDTPEHSRYIKTVRGVGYRFVGGEG